MTQDLPDDWEWRGDRAVHKRATSWWVEFADGQLLRIEGAHEAPIEVILAVITRSTRAQR